MSDRPGGRPLMVADHQPEVCAGAGASPAVGIAFRTVRAGRSEPNDPPRGSGIIRDRTPRCVTLFAAEAAPTTLRSGVLRDAATRPRGFIRDRAPRCVTLFAAEAAPTTLRSGVLRDAATRLVGADLSAIERQDASRFSRLKPLPRRCARAFRADSYGNFQNRPAPSAPLWRQFR